MDLLEILRNRIRDKLIERGCYGAGDFNALVDDYLEKAIRHLADIAVGEDD
jgi:hypothetical protein